MPVGFSNVQIANLALSKAGAISTVEDFAENSKPARVTQLWLTSARLKALEAHNWAFAKKSQALATHSQAAPTNRWAYRYQWPSDCVTPRYLENPLGDDADALPYESELADDDTQSILANVDKAVLVYTKDLDRPDIFPLHFIDMMAAQLAIYISPELVGKESRIKALGEEFNQLALLAPWVDATSQVKKPEREASWIRSR